MRFEKCRRRDANVQRIAIATCRDLPDVFERLLCCLRHLDPAVLRLVPGLAHVCALAEFRPEMPTRRPGPHLVTPLPLIEERRVNRETREVRPIDRPFTAIAAEEEE